MQSEALADRASSIIGVKHAKEGGKLTKRSGYIATADSPSSSSSYSIITLTESPDEVMNHGSLQSNHEAVTVSVVQALDSSEQQQLSCTAVLVSDMPTSSGHDLSTITTPAMAISLPTSCCDNSIEVFVDHLERRVTLHRKPQLNITENFAAQYYSSASLPSLPAIVESCRSDDAQLSDNASVASGDGYVADSGVVRSESCLSSSSSPTSSLAKSVDRQRETCISDGANFSVTSSSICGDRSVQLESIVSALSTAVAGGGRQLSTKSSSDGIDSAVVSCTPYSSQTSQDSSSTVDNTVSSYCHSVIDAIDDEALQPLPSADDEMHSSRWENDEVKHKTVSVIADEEADHEFVGQDSDDEISMTSLKVEWEIGSDIETLKHSQIHMAIAGSVKPNKSVVQQPFLNMVSSIQSLTERAPELEMHWSDELVAKRACCACMSCMIMHQCVSTAGDVIPTISIRMCSSFVDIVCLIQRLIVTCSTWLQVLCDTALCMERLCHSYSDRYSPNSPASVTHADDITDGSVHSNQQHYNISEGLGHIRASLLQQLIDVTTTH